MSGFMVNVKRLLSGTGTRMDLVLLNTRSCKKLVNILSPELLKRNYAELESATSSSDAGMADCRVRRVGEAGSNR